MNKNIYKISNLNCKYAASLKPVLYIEELCIAKGSKTFFIGASGVGKSTILETLGIMNNTIHDIDGVDAVFEFIDRIGVATDLKKIWQWNEKKIANFRNENLSFIFQNTNLFKTLSAFDNIAISAIIQGKTKAQAQAATTDIVRQILPDLTYDKPITELSGGQRQRIAFARAVVADYTVLFADEPTGNLDVGNAENLMNVLMKNIAEKTAVIVTHDIKLALKFADKIVLIERIIDSDKFKSGFINSKTIFHKEGALKWRNSEKEFTQTDLEELLLSKIISQSK